MQYHFCCIAANENYSASLQCIVKLESEWWDHKQGDELVEPDDFLGRYPRPSVCLSKEGGIQLTEFSIFEV